MKAHEEVEQALQGLGSDWPQNDSLVDRVVCGLETSPPVADTRSQRPQWVRRAIVGATALTAAVILGLTLRTEETLLAQVRDAVRAARTFQWVVTAPGQGDEPAQVIQGCWYERGVGFREETPAQVTIGNTRGTWRHLKDSQLAVYSGGNVISAMVDQMLDHNNLGRPLNGEQDLKRYAEADETVDGQPCQAYLLMPGSPDIAPELQNEQHRFIYLLNERSRLLRVRNEVRSGDAWSVQYLYDLNYDAPIDRAQFEPRFREDVRVVDLDAAFEEFVNLEEAVYREERRGLIYAIHHVERFQNGGIFLISSVRGTDATLRKYPLTRDRFGSDRIRVTGPATNYYGSQEYRIPGMDIELGSMSHQGIHVSWRALTPFDPDAADPFGVAPGQVKVPAGFSPTGGEYGQENFLDENGVMQYLTWDIVLDVPMPTALPSFEAITRKVYADFTALDAVHFKFLNMGHRGMMAVYLSDLKEISLTDYQAAVTDDVRWWKDGCPQDDPRLRELRGTPTTKKD